MSEKLPFEILARHTGKETVMFIAVIDGQEITSEKYSIGNGKERKRVAIKWSKDDRLCNGSLVSNRLNESELERKEFQVKELLDNPIDSEDGDLPHIERASIIDKEIIAEMAWNYKLGRPDFIIYDRESKTITREEAIEKDGYTIIPPKCWRGICTPGEHIEGSILIPSNTRTVENIESYEIILRSKIKSFVNRYVELPDGVDELCVEYVMLSWLHDLFDELPYLAFRTADYGRGKSRALETIGSLCYRLMFCGGGSTAAATLRLLDIFRGTLLADEFDQQQLTCPRYLYHFLS